VEHPAFQVKYDHITFISGHEHCP